MKLFKHSTALCKVIVAIGSGKTIETSCMYIATAYTCCDQAYTVKNRPNFSGKLPVNFITGAPTKIRVRTTKQISRKPVNLVLYP
jgi:hypothetical protein